MFLCANYYKIHGQIKKKILTPPLNTLVGVTTTKHIIEVKCGKYN